jgi:hypothetical protein
MNLFLCVHMQQIMGRMYMGLESVQQWAGILLLKDNSLLAAGCEYRSLCKFKKILNS